MSIHLKIGLLTLTFLGGMLHLQGQVVERFDPNAGTLIQQLRTHFGSKQPEETKKLLVKLEELIRSDVIQENQVIDLAETANLLLDRGAQPHPHFSSYLTCFIGLVGRAEDLSNYRIWSAEVKRVLTGADMSLASFQIILNVTESFQSNGILCKSGMTNWKVNPSRGTYGVDSLFFISVKNASLIGTSGTDSVTILRTDGKFYPKNRQWLGNQGVITWERAGIPENEVFAQLIEYELDLGRSVVNIDSVNLHYPRYFEFPVIGSIEDKVLPGMRAAQAGYPRFTSYELKNRIKDLYPQMDYEGGFTLHGRKVIGSGLPENKAVLTIFRENTPLIRLASTYFVFDENRARGLNTEVTLYLDTDSIFHPGLLFQYSVPSREVDLVRDGQGLSNSRYFDSYHQLDFDVELIRWYQGDSLVSMSGMVGSIENRASFESADYFSFEWFNKILLMDKSHPLSMVKQCADFMRSNIYTVDDLSRFMGQPIHLVQEMCLNLSFQGFIRFNSESGIIEVRGKSYDFLKKHAGLQDYDLLRFESVHQPPEANAILNLNNLHLKVFWVSGIELSRSRNVRIIPDGQTVTVLKGRDLLFDGTVIGGLLRFKGTHFKFHYDPFQIQMDSIDNIRIQVYDLPANPQSTPKLVDVTSVIENTSGVLSIDRFDHKSGIKPEKIPGYPAFKTDTFAFVYYDQRSILNGIYKRDTFFFRITPFDLKELNNIKLAEFLRFPGRFQTAGIFPPLEIEISHQTDHSLGFDTLRTPPYGLPIYNGKGRFFETIRMSQSGLRGSGRLEYLSATLESGDFLFLPDKVITTARSFAIQKDSAMVGNPETKGIDLAVEWSPGQDRMIASGKENPLSIYGDVKFDGNLQIDPDGLKGQGTLSMENFTISSDRFTFFQHSFEADQALFTLYDKSSTDSTVGTRNKLFVSQNGTGRFNLQRRNASFITEEKPIQTSLPTIQYQGFSGSFDWDMNGNLIQLKETDWVTAHPRQDSLRFRSESTIFDPAVPRITADAVESVEVADVRILPRDKQISIRNGAIMDTLFNATIMSRDTTFHHRIVGSTVLIGGKNRYSAAGTYAYRDVSGREFPVYFSDIRVRDGISEGAGTITENQQFALSPNFRFKGDVYWKNNEKELTFDGSVQLVYDCPDITRNWITFNHTIQPDSVRIRMDSISLNSESSRLYKGFYLSNQPIELYSTFVGPHVRYSDHPVIESSGWLFYDYARSRYRITDAVKMNDPGAEGNTLDLYDKECLTIAEGQLDLGMDLGAMKISAAGSIQHNLVLDSITSGLILSVDFFLDNRAMDFFAKAINNSAEAEPVNFTDPEFRKNFSLFLGQERGTELLDQLGLFGRWKRLPDELIHSIVFSELKLAWNASTGSYQSVGKLGIAVINGEAVNKRIDGNLELTHRRGGDVFTLYLEPEPGNYFFFYYSRGLMQVIAGPKFEKFNTTIRDVKESKRKLNPDPGQPDYQFYLGQYRLVRDFLDRMNTR